MLGSVARHLRTREKLGKNRGFETEPRRVGEHRSWFPPATAVGRQNRIHGSTAVRPPSQHFS